MAAIGATLCLIINASSFLVRVALLGNKDITQLTFFSCKITTCWSYVVVVPKELLTDVDFFDKIICVRK